MFIHAEREFKILYNLKENHNIAYVIEYIPEPNWSRGYLVMEKIVGKNLLDLVSEDSPLSE